jgi:hypothetical protein
MSQNVVPAQCSEAERKDDIFGICDDQAGTKAYTDADQNNSGSWIATVKNVNHVAVTFTAIDNCAIFLKPGTEEKMSTCDGLLTFNNSFYLVELKVQRTGGWITTAIGQLESSIKILLAIGIPAQYKYKKAFACNRKHPYFQSIDNELNKRFFRTYGFRIDVQAEIVIK